LCLSIFNLFHDSSFFISVSTLKSSFCVTITAPITFFHTLYTSMYMRSHYTTLHIYCLLIHAHADTGSPHYNWNTILLTQICGMASMASRSAHLLAELRDLCYLLEISTDGRPTSSQMKLVWPDRLNHGIDPVYAVVSQFSMFHRFGLMVKWRQITYSKLWLLVDFLL